MPRITFMPSGVVADCSKGETIFSVGRRHHEQTQIPTSCVGSGTCGLCRVKVLAGEEHLSDYTEVEAKHLGNMYYLTKVRLSCQTRVGGGDVVVEVSRPSPRQVKARTRTS